MTESTTSPSASSPHALLTHLFFTVPAERKDARWRGIAGSLAIHSLLLALALWLTSPRGLLLLTDLGVGAGVSKGAAGGGGGGGEDVAYMELSSPPKAQEAVEQVVPEPPPPVPPPVPVPTPVPAPEVKPVETPVVQQVAILGAANGTGTQTAGSGTGAGPGQGPGSGGGSGGGEGGGIGTSVGPGTGKGRILAPYPEFLLIPPTAPGNVRGKTVTVRLAIDESGAVRDVELMPATGDRGYDKELKRVAQGWKFKPARDPGNNPVAVQFDVVFTF
jgi:protein TonB